MMHMSQPRVSSDCLWITCMQVKARYDSGGISAIVDPRLEGAHDAEMYKAMTDIAIQCSMYDRTLRPSTTVSQTCRKENTQ